MENTNTQAWRESGKDVKKFNRIKPISLSSDEDDDLNNQICPSNNKRPLLTLNDNAISSSDDSQKEKEKYKKTLIKKDENTSKSISGIEDIIIETEKRLESDTLLNRQLSEIGLSGISSTDEDSNDWDFAIKKTPKISIDSPSLKDKEKSTPSLLTNTNLKCDTNSSLKNVQRKTILIQDQSNAPRFVI